MVEQLQSHAIRDIRLTVVDTPSVKLQKHMRIQYQAVHLSLEVFNIHLVLSGMFVIFEFRRIHFEMILFLDSIGLRIDSMIIVVVNTILCRGNSTID